MMKNRGLLFLIVFLLAGFSGPAHAKLVVIGTATYTGAGANDMTGALGGGGGLADPVGSEDAAGDYNLIYDDDQGLVWLDFSNGRGIWPIQLKWAAGLNDPGVLTYRLNSGVSVSWEGEWRLPRAVDGPRYFGYDGKANTAGYNITTDEMGYLFYKALGNKAGLDGTGDRQSGGGLRDTGPFTHLKSSTYYTGTSYLHYEGIWCWNFNMSSGLLNTWALAEEGFNALAVRPAKVSGAN